MLKAMQQAEKAFGVIRSMMIDDPGFARGPVVGAVVEAMAGIFAARDALINEQALLGPGTHGDRKKVENPTHLFLTLVS